MQTNTIQIRKKGNLTLPMKLRSKYGLGEGDVFILIDLGDGSFLLTLRISEVSRLANRVTAILDEEDVTEDDFLSTLNEDREQYYREHYA